MTKTLVRYECIHPITTECRYVVEGASGLSKEEVQKLAIEQKLQNFEIDVQRDEVANAVQNLFQFGEVESLKEEEE